ncbi:siderophore-interacting protein [Photobacterium japonica]|uniref:siderophore-interacting protein n=1 Tax=Photobacterium japonica TaxID=2910235 RepID=UPI003D0AC762
MNKFNLAAALQEHKIKTLTVLSNDCITPNMQRVVFGGEDVARFPADCAGHYVKLLFSPEGETSTDALLASAKPVMRTLTISERDMEQGTLSVDFVRHAELATPFDPSQGGYAAYFAVNAKAGDTLCFAGPQPIQSYMTEADWYLLVADMTSLTAVMAKAATLPADAKGYVVVNVTTRADVQAMALPEGVTLIVHAQDESTQSLVEVVAELAWLSGKVAVWCACEFSAMKAIRGYVNGEREVPRTDCYISSYWKQGVTEEGHKVLKHEDNEAQANA